MVKAIVTSLIVIAIANLLAMLAFAGYLASSDRLDLVRIRKIRELVSTTLTDERAKEAQAAAKVTADAKVAEEAEKSRKPPLTAAEQLSARIEATQLDRERASRLRQEVEGLQRQLSLQISKIVQDRSEFELARKQYEKQVTDANEATRSAQFQKSLNVLTALKPAAAKAVLLQMIQLPAGALAGGIPTLPSELTAGTSATAVRIPAAAPERDLAPMIFYLDAMEERPRAKIMAEFAKDDPTLSARMIKMLKDQRQFAISKP